MILELLKNPLALPALIRFGKQSQRAAASLAGFLENYLQELTGKDTGTSSPRSDRGMSGTGTVVEQLRTMGPIPKTMRAGVYRDKGVVRVEEVPVPEVGDGEVLIKVAACGICGTDIKKIFYRYVEPPQILGHELAGTVVAIGRGVTKWKPGDRVMSFHHIPCGKCFYCERRMFSQCKLYKNTGLTAGLHAQWRRLRRIRKSHALGGGAGDRGASRTTSASKKPPSSSRSTPSLKPCKKPACTAGETVLVIGCGPIGLQLLMVTQIEGARIYTSDPIATRRAKEHQVGSPRVI